MGCKLSYWDCKFNNYDESYDEENGEIRYYGCTHNDGDGNCDKKNKWGDSEDYCELAEKEED